RFGIKCNDPNSPKTQLAVFILAGDQWVPPIRLRLKSDWPARRVLANYSSVDLMYSGGPPLTVNPAQSGWIPISNTAEGGNLLAVAWVLCVAANDICADRNAVLTNLADVVGAPSPAGPAETPARGPAGVPPPGIMAQAPPAPSTEKQLTPPSLPG